MARSRWELEEKKKKKALEAVKQAAQAGTAYRAPKTTQEAAKAATGTVISRPAQKSATSSRSAAAAAPVKAAPTAQKQSGFRSLAKLPETVKRTAAPTVAAAQQRASDRSRLQKNMLAWHGADTAGRRALEQENAAIRGRLGLAYNARTGVTYDPQTGKNYSLPTQLAFGQDAGRRARTASQYPTSREFAGQGADSVSLRPSMQQIAAGVGEEAKGANAHRVLADLFSRSGEAWTEQDRENRDAAVLALEDEMARILSRYGLRYSRSGLGASDMWGMPDTVSDRNAAERLRQAGADADEIAYIEENIALREGTHRIRQGAEAAGKGFAGGIASLGENIAQNYENWQENQQNPEYRAAQDELRQIETRMGLTPRQNADGTMNSEYAALEQRAEELRAKMLLVSDTGRVDPDAWGQRMLREAGQAQENATAGLAPVPRFLAGQGISIAQNLPAMGAAAIPVVGPAAAATMMGAGAAGQRAYELNQRADVSPGEALRRGLISGAVEAATEKFPLDAWADLLTRGGTGLVKDLLRQMGIEATEEGASYVLNYAADRASGDPKAAFSFQELAENAMGGAVSGLFFGTAGTLAGRARRSTSVDTNPATHTPEQMAKINEYVDAVDEGLLEFVQQTAAGETTGTYQLENVSDRAAHDIHAITGIDATGFQTKIEPRMIRHIIARHGANGNADHSMADANDIARIQYVLNNYDQMLDGGYSNAYKEPNPNMPGRNRNARTVVYVKKINGSYYVVEAVPVSRQKTAFITSTYMQKGDQPILNAPNNAPGSTSENASLNLLNNNIAQNGVDGNPVQELTARLAELDAEKRAAEGALPGPARDARIAEVRREIEQTAGELRGQTIAERTAAALARDKPLAVSEWPEGMRKPVLAGEQEQRPQSAYLTPEEDAALQAELSAHFAEEQTVNTGGIYDRDTMRAALSQAIQYGKTPEQAVMEAQARAQGEAIKAAREAKEADILDRITNGKTGDIRADVRMAMQRARRISERHKLQRATVRAAASDADRYIRTESENMAVELVNSLESERSFLRTLRKAWNLSDAELVNAKEIAAGRGPVTQMSDNRLELVETYARALRQYQSDMGPAYDFYNEMNAARTKRAEELIAASDDWKDARIGYQLKIRTPARVIRQVMGDTPEAKAVYDAYFAPVIQHDAESVRWERQMRDRLKKAMAGLSHEDSVYIHLKNRSELNPKNDALQKLFAEYTEKNRSKIHFTEADAAMEELIRLTQEIHPEVNEAWVRNGIEPLEFHKRYIPSLTPAKEGKWWNRLLRGFGIETMADELPNDIAGRTENRRPGHQYAAFANEREGVNTEFDAFRAVDNYISSAANAIFHTDDIQNLRTLEETIRYKYSDEGAQAELLAVRQNPNLTIEERVQQMSEIWSKNEGTLPHFPSWIAEYTNLLAGKKARGDRQTESDLNRGVFRAMTDLEGKIAANMAGGNLSTALSNFIPFAQGAGELHYTSMAKAMLDYTCDLLHRDGTFREASDFLTNRRGSERVVKTGLQRASEIASTPMQAIDHLTSEVLTRARYLDNLGRGMKQQDALREAGRWAAGLMGDRAKGAKPIIFEEKGPIQKAFTMFQLEVANQYDYLFGDIPANARAQGKGKAGVIAHTAGALLQIFILSHLFNDAREELTGTRGALDPIEIVNDYIGRATGYALPNVFTLVREALEGGLTAEDFQTEAAGSTWENIQTTAQDVVSNLPFLSGPVGAFFGASNARLPVQSVIPNLSSIFSKSGEARKEAAIKEMAKPIYGILFPFGGTQAKKTVEGVSTMLAGGSYVHDNDGNLKLQFPAYGEKPLDWLRATLFGKYSSKEAQDYIDSGFKGLSAKETAAYNSMRDDAGIPPKDAMEAILSLRGFESDKDGETGLSVKDQQRQALFANEKLTVQQKAGLDRALIVTGEDELPADYTDYTTFMLYRVRDNRRQAAQDALEHGLTIDQFISWDDRLSDLAGETGEDDKRVRSAAEARGMALDEVMQDAALSDSEKQAVADYVLISSMGDEEDKTRKDWEEIARGKVNASDFLRFKTDVSGYEEAYKNTGADNAANVAAILRGYEGLDDGERDVLFQTYSRTMKNNPFHVSEYEQRMQDNGFFGELNADGKAAVRSLANEYEQAVREGKDLEGSWMGKAYMAKEAGISPETYILFRTALKMNNYDGNGSYKNTEIEYAVKMLPGLTDSQRAYLWQSANGKDSTKNNPWGYAKVTKYQSGVPEAINPVANGTQTSAFGPREAPTAGASTEHMGLDIGAAEGEPVKAILSGKVVSTGYDSGGGYFVQIDHGDGRMSTYMHMKAGSTDGINVGDEIGQGQQIGAVGSTGVSTGPHLDIRITQDGKYIDPLTVIPGYGIAPSGYVDDGSHSAGVMASGRAQAAAKGSGSSGLKPLPTFKGLKKLGF